MPDTVPVTLCICTIDRIELLSNALDSIARSPLQPAEVIVSDDSPNDRTMELVRARYPSVRYVRGPRSGGIGGNRNRTAKLVTQPHLAFIDDDAEVPESFFSEIEAIIRETPEAVVTGRVRNHFKDGRLDVETPNASNFLGYCTKPWGTGTGNMITMSATVFPRALFDVADFDPRLVYGFEEIDISRRAEAAGFPVLFRHSFIVDHFPQQTDDWYREHVDVSRLYSTWNFYRSMQHKPATAQAFFIAASAHLMLNGARRRHGIRSVAAARRDIRGARTLIRDAVSEQR